MTTPSFDDIRRRHLIVIATGEYDHDKWQTLDVESEVKVWRDWLLNDALEDRKFVHIEKVLAESPSGKKLSRRLKSDKFRATVHSNDAVVLLITGHGVVVDDSHRFVLRDSDPGKPETLQRTDEVIGILRDTEVQNALVVIDTCRAGFLVAAVAKLTTSLPDRWLGLAAAAPQGQARLGAVSVAVQAFLTSGFEKYGSELEPYFRPGDLINFVASKVYENDPAQKIVSFPHLPVSEEGWVCLPNPRYQRDRQDLVATTGARRALAMRAEDLEAHWDPRARGVEHASEPGWWFTGRTALMRALVAAVRGGPGTFVVTGTAGCGKSAVLSRLVTLSDPKFRSDHQDLVDAIWADLRPRAGDVDVALLATGLTSVDILDQLCNALGVKPAPLQGSGLAAETAGRHRALRERLASGPPVTIVLDALDEAADPWSVLSDVLRPLVEDWHRPSLRLVIGVRSPEPRTSISSMDPSAALGARTLLGATARDLHLDDDHILRADTGIYWDEGDLTAYIVNRLMNPPRGVHSPYQDSVEEATELARNLAELAGKSYVVAQVVARDLASAS